MSKSALIMGLGLNAQGSGTSVALYLLKQGYHLTITDLRPAEVLQPTIALFQDYKEKIEWVLGEHRQADFDKAELVVKNPGVHKDSPFLKNVDPNKIVSDIALFLQAKQPNLIAVTGSKGKSSTVTALQGIYTLAGKKSYLGGNITVSPLNFIEDLKESENLILELSSWQLGDLGGKNLLHPHIAVITNLMADHQNYYHNDMKAYALDKAVILEGQKPTDWAVFNLNDDWTPFFEERCKAQKAYFSIERPNKMPNFCGFLENNEVVWHCNNKEERYAKPTSFLLDDNLVATLTVLALQGFNLNEVCKLLTGLQGVANRMEFVGQVQGRSFYNDTAATIPEATIAALKKFPACHLVMGGADKELNFEALAPFLRAVKGITLLQGTATDKIVTTFQKHNIPFNGPFSNFEEALSFTFNLSKEGDTILLSPACASFGMFKNEFERGERFRLFCKQILACG